MKFSFIRYNPELSEKVERTVRWALDPTEHEYEFLDANEHSKATGEYVFWMDNVYNLEALRITCDYIVEVPNRDIYYMGIMRRTGLEKYKICNPGIRIDESCPMGVVFKNELIKDIPYDGYFDTFWIKASGVTINTCKVDYDITMGMSLTAPLGKGYHWGTDIGLGELVARYRSLKTVDVTNGRTWFILDRNLDLLRRSILTKINDDRLLLGKVAYDRIYQLITE